MSLLGIERSHTSTNDGYNHAIDLVDSTKPQPQAEDSDGETGRAPSISGAIGAKTVATRKSTRDHLRKELARRKYAKWQDGKEVEESIEETNFVKSTSQKPTPSETARKSRLRDKISLRSKKKPAKHNHELQTFVDVLYENQRGWWLCGIPLYSSNSLLNFDPAAWQTSTFQDSPVNITNAQVPDPSWQWAWRHWYVDMSYDVDEEGWQYSFSFNTQFAWHGNHPWYHSYVRRRRWLRKRVKKDAYLQGKHGGTMTEGHHLNPDYFTIHPSGRDRSRGSSNDRGTIRQSSFTDTYTTSETDDEVQEIENTATLLAALKMARVDREKIAAVRMFLDHGGEELHYLSQTMPTILDDFVHQSSRRQLLFLLRQYVDAARNNKRAADEEAQGVNERLVNDLQKALEEARSYAREVNYWSDLGFTAIDASTPISTVQSSEDSSHANESNLEKVNTEIKGLPSDAHFAEPHVGDISQPQNDGGGLDDDNDNDGWEDPPSKLAKGKRKA